MRLDTASSIDIPALCFMEQLCFGDYAEHQSHILYALHNPNAYLPVIRENDNLIARAHYLNRKNSTYLRLYSLCVLPEARGMGCGKTLIKAGIDYGKKLGKKGLTLEVKTSNKFALALYKNMGFVTIKTLSSYYSCYEDGLKMRYLWED